MASSDRISFSYFSSVWSSLASRLGRRPRTAIDALPNEILIQVLAYLQPSSDLFAVCKRWGQQKERLIDFSIRADISKIGSVVSGFFAFEDCKNLEIRCHFIASFANLERPLRKREDFQRVLDLQLVKFATILRSQDPAVPQFLATDLTVRARTIRQAFNEQPAWMQTQVKIDLSGRSLTVFPSEILLFRNLEEVNVSCNEIHVLPPELLNARQLKKLDLSDNSLESLPDWFPTLAERVEVDLSGNPVDPAKSSSV